MIFQNKQLHINVNTNNSAMSISGVDWLIDHIFNNGAPYIYTGANKRQFGHYNDSWNWKATSCYTLTISGLIKRRANKNMPWTYFE